MIDLKNTKLKYIALVLVLFGTLFIISNFRSWFDSGNNAFNSGLDEMDFTVAVNYQVGSLNEVLSTGESDRFGMYRVLGNSMLPRFKTGDYLIYDRFGFDSVEKDQVILFRHRGMIYVHQVVRASDNVFQTRGINNFEADGVLITEDNYVGTLLAVYFSP